MSRSTRAQRRAQWSRQPRHPTRSRTGLPPLIAAILAPSKTRSLTDLAAGGVRTATTVPVYDSVGRVVRQTESGDGVPDICTSTSYAENLNSWIRNKVSETITSQQVCPAPGTTPTPILTDARTFYDGQTTLGTVTGAGDATRTDSATANNNGTLTFATTGTGTFDASGRPLTVTDALNRTTSLAYTPADSGNLTQTVTTNSLNQTATVNLDPARGLTTSTIDIATHRTDATYDALGRLTAVWLPGHSMAASDPASATAPEAVTTNTLVRTSSMSTYVTSVKIYDALGQLKQTQTAAEGGGRAVSDNFYDSHGWLTASNDRYNTDGAPSTTLISVDPQTVNSRTITTFDAAGRAIDSAAYNGLTLTWHTKTVYGGDRTTVIPPTGGVTTSTLTDIRGHTTETRHYTAQPTVNGSVVTGGTYQATLQAYTPLGQVNKITDADGNVWTSTYDMLGRKIQATDPGTGTTSYTYDLAGQLSTSTDARGQTLAYTYDNLGRKSAEYSGSTSGTKLASWVYDTIQKGKLTSSTRYTPQGNYLVGYGAYDGQGNPTSQTVQLPASETGLAGNYTTKFAFIDAGRIAQVLPVTAGGLPGEWVNTHYDSLGNISAVDGYNAYVAASRYTPYNEPAQYTLGDPGAGSSLTYSLDDQTRRLTHVNFSAQTATPQLDDITYSYDPVGNPTRSVDVQGAAGGPTQTQCYSYGALDRLSQAWTATDNCAGAPSASNVGGTAPYWLSWTFNATGLRTTQTQHALPGATGGDTTTTYTYPAAGAAQSSALTSTATTGPAGNSGTSYTYDAVGNTLTRTLPAGNQTLTWDAENYLATDTTPAGATSYVYDADGNQLVRHDPGSTTLFLPMEELTYNNTSQTIIGTRFYAINGQTIAERVGGANPTFLAGDPHGSMQVDYAFPVDTGTGSVTRRSLDPYGNPLGTITTTANGTTTLSAWPDQHGFLNKPQDGNTGLTDVGARKYDPTTGRFISVDPLLTLSNPQTGNGYTYSADNPLSFSDPSGLIVQIDGHAAWIGGDSDYARAYNAGIARSWASSIAANPYSFVNWTNSMPGDYWVEKAKREAVLRRANEEPHPLVGLNPSAEESAGNGFMNFLGSVGHFLYKASGVEDIQNSCINKFNFVDCLNGIVTTAGWVIPVYGELNAGKVVVDGAIEGANAFLEGERAESAAADAAANCARNSFNGDTPVLMANGEPKRIDQVKVGDTITNSEPDSPRAGPQSHGHPHHRHRPRLRRRHRRHARRPQGDHLNRSPPVLGRHHPRLGRRRRPRPRATAGHLG
ncbi:hypothetical protein ORV05_22570 [Amycolatopsis cynarae]|uniref:RHS repeat-associated core domain-containing protein n=1 Tax=Amycolatopsis cynarae TaxID=2995223 RepID=A0ABY7AUX2_9PSEU|nr:RHS repeat-associated core domain-containing protein [Amycolatopsis sp. HUAS 11-8]WAL63775.1 hypothetical protein ORV05_22570 [Amycolatopsis sp. HUAS 11-8]